MADVVVKISGDNQELGRTLTDSEKRLKGFSKKSQQASSGIASIGSSSTKATSKLSLLANKFAGGLGISAAIGGIKLFGAVVDEVMSRAQRQAALTESAFSSAFSKATAFDLGGESFTFESRDQIVKAGQIAQQELNKVKADLERNFSSFINLPFFEEKLSKGLAAGSLFGLGEDQSRLLRSLVSQRNILQERVDAFTKAADEQLALNQLTQRYSNEIGVASDKQKEVAESLKKTREEAELLENIRPNFSGPIDVSGFQRFRTSDVGPLPPGVPEVEDVIDPSITLELLSLERAVNAGVIPSLDGMEQKAGLLQQQLLFMLEQGVSPANAEFQTMLANMKALQNQTSALSAGVLEDAIAMRVLGDIGIGVLDEIAFKFEEATTEAAKLRNTLRSIASRFLNVALNAGINVGIGALTGNPLSFGQALASGLGIPTGSTAAVGAVGQASGVASKASFQRPQLEVKALRIGGGDLLLTLQEAQGRRGTGGISLD